MDRLPKIDFDGIAEDIADEYMSVVFNNEPTNYLDMTDKQIEKDFYQYAESALVDNPELYVEEEMDHKHVRENHQKIIKLANKIVMEMAKKELEELRALKEGKVKNFEDWAIDDFA
jgi:hypothetical protein